ncbi:MAG: FAD-dependent oxidoreductase [Actinomycetota bacterium]
MVRPGLVMATDHEFIVVGAGVLGLSAGRALTARGREAVVLEQATAGHPGSGSHGTCRIFRLGYPDPGYVAMAAQSRELWRELESQAGQQILGPTAHLTFGPGLGAVHEGMSRAGAPTELLPASEVAARFPGLVVGGPALLEPESGVLAADVALSALAATGAPVRPGFRVASLSDDGRQVTLREAGGAVLTARHVIVCAGPWTAQLLAPAGLAVPSAPTLEQVAYLAPIGDPPPGMPIFIRHPEPAPYGLPVPGSPLYKLGIHPSGPATDPDWQDPGQDDALLARFSELAAAYLPGFNPVPVAAERCIYDNSPDEDFILDRSGRITVGSGTSGHGFKFGPLIGGWLASLAADDPGGPPADRFGLGRFSAAAAGGSGPR